MVVDWIRVLTAPCASLEVFLSSISFP